jgi:hypothetical protein
MLATFYSVTAQGAFGRAIDINDGMKLFDKTTTAARQSSTPLARAIVRWIDTNRNTYQGDDLLRINLVEAAHQAYLVMLAEVQA